MDDEGVERVGEVPEPDQILVDILGYLHGVICNYIPLICGVFWYWVLMFFGAFMANKLKHGSPSPDAHVCAGSDDGVEAVRAADGVHAGHTR